MSLMEVFAPVYPKWVILSPEEALSQRRDGRGFHVPTYGRATKR
jgi:hypothetical protein